MSGWSPEPDGSRRGLIIGAVCCVLAVLLMVCIGKHPEWRQQHPPAPTPSVSEQHAPRPRR